MRKLVIVLMTIMSMVLLTACGGSSIGGKDGRYAEKHREACQ